jgi:PAS domain S-box-containing protein
VTDGLPLSVFVKDLQGRYLFINTPGARSLGRSVEEVLGRADTDLFSRESAEKILEEDRRVMDQAETRTSEETGTADGVTRTYLSTKGPYRDAEGRIIGLVGIAQDITDRKRAEERLATQYAVTRELSQSTISGVLRAICLNLGWQWGALWAVDPQENALHCAEVWRSPSADLGSFEETSLRTRFAPGKGLPGRVWSSRHPVWIRDVQKDPNFPRLPQAAEAGLHGALGIPISIRGQCLGVIEFLCHEVRDVEEDNFRMLASLGEQLGLFLHRKRAEEALAESEARKRAILEAALDCIITIDQEGKVVEWNPAAEKTFGYRREQAVGREMAEIIIPPSSRESHRRGLARYLETGEGPVLGQRLELPAMRSDGSFFPAELTIVPILLTGRRLFTGYLRDITERKRAEEEILQQREWLEVTLSSIGDAVMATDTGGRLTFMNSVAETLTGWNREDAVGKPLDEVFHIVHEETREPVETPVSKVLREGGVQGLANLSVLIAKDGVERPIDDCAAPIRDRAGTSLGVVLIFHDVSERRELERELTERAQKLSEADRRKDEFLAMLAHELRNPLAPVRNALHILRLMGSDPQRVEEVREIMDRQVQHLGRLVDDLLDVSRITRGKIALHHERLDWARLIRLGVADRRSTLEEAGLQLTLEAPEVPVWVNADPTRMAQVLDNLLDNARKFTGRSGEVSVRLTAPASSEEAVLTVSDTGVGIEPGMIQRLFEPFVQADNSLDRSRGGLGLGLALVKGLVELHGGTVLARSDGIGSGATITVRLPREKEKPALTQNKGSLTPAATKRWHVLVVEDNRDSAESLRMLLELSGYQVSVAYTGPTGVETATQERPDVVLCDIGLPGMDGFAVAGALRQNPATAATRLIAVTGYGQEQDRLRAIQAGFDDHLVKPVDPQVLLGHLGEADGHSESAS